MSNAVEDRLKELKKLQREARKDPDNNQKYLEDLEISIKHCEAEAKKVI